jgi:hypothetical protein
MKFNFRRVLVQNLLESFQEHRLLCQSNFVVLHIWVASYKTYCFQALNYNVLRVLFKLLICLAVLRTILKAGDDSAEIVDVPGLTNHEDEFCRATQVDHKLAAIQKRLKVHNFECFGNPCKYVV